MIIMISIDNSLSMFFKYFLKKKLKKVTHFLVSVLKSSTFFKTYKTIFSIHLSEIPKILKKINLSTVLGFFYDIN